MPSILAMFGSGRTAKPSGASGHFDAAVDEGADGLLPSCAGRPSREEPFNGGRTTQNWPASSTKTSLTKSGRFSSTETAITPSGVSKESSQAMRWAGRENEPLGAGENGLGRGRFGRQELGKKSSF